MSNFEDLTTIILLGGKGTRLKSVVSDRPKVMADINGKPFLEILLDGLIKTGIRKVIFSTGFKSDYIKKNIGNKFKSLNIIYSQEDTPLGTGGAVSLATKILQSRDYLIMNGDNFIEYDLNSFFNDHLNNNREASILVKKVEDARRFGTILFDNDHKVLEFKEKDPTSKNAYINCGVYILNSSILRYLPPNSNFSLEFDFFPNITDKRFYAFETMGRHLDIGTPDTYKSAQYFFK